VAKGKDDLQTNGELPDSALKKNDFEGLSEPLTGGRGKVGPAEEKSHE